MEYWRHFVHEPVGDNEWLAFADPDSCPYDCVPAFVRENGFLPAECLNCYKPLIFWKSDAKTSSKFKKLLVSLDVGVEGKYNDEVVVFYTRSLRMVRELGDILTAKLAEFRIDGRFQWRISGRYWQKMFPEFFDSAKELSIKAYPKTVPWLSAEKWLARKEKKSL